MKNNKIQRILEVLLEEENGRIKQNDWQYLDLHRALPELKEGEALYIISELCKPLVDEGAIELYADLPGKTHDFYLNPTRAREVCYSRKFQEIPETPFYKSLDWYYKIASILSLVTSIGLAFLSNYQLGEIQKLKDKEPRDSIKIEQLSTKINGLDSLLRIKKTLQDTSSKK